MKVRLKSESLWHGLATAIVNDGVVDNDEISLLYKMLCQYKDLKSGPLKDLKLLIERICSDSVVNSDERLELLQFLQAFIDTKTPSEKGTAFEMYVITCFDNKQFRLIEWRSDKYIPNWGGPVSCRWPDLVMEHISTGKRFAIECKFRSSPRAGKVEWARPEQINNYIQYEAREQIPVYVALGLGGAPNSPQALYVMRLRHMNEPIILMQDLDRFAVHSSVVELDLNEK
ncbi:MAG TPA: hypothetical protein DCZ95_19805 [Verrucomicrobia bacterium]|nr:MAG: hypothetical protein A2X46_11035 [Lentisphaerae bacterium GWF2_57_35]HBA86332.1 hypothetical protein [Verrucomicrobiota bacterium]